MNLAPMGLPQRDLLVLLSGPVILLLRFIICNSGSVLNESAVCDVSALMRMLKIHEPWEAFYALHPKDGWLDASAVVLLLTCLLLLFLLAFCFFNFAPKTPIFYIQPSQGLNELGLRFISMFMRAAYAIAYMWAFYNHYTNPESGAPDAHKYAMHAICSHYIVRGVEALLLRRYSAPFFPPQQAHPTPLVYGICVYMYHYFLVYAHFTWMSTAAWGLDGNGAEVGVNQEWMYMGYIIAVFGQVLMLKQADSIPKSTLRTGFVWKGEVISWVGIGFISQHPGVWILVASMVPFTYFEELVECWTGQRYARLCTPLRSKCAVFIKDAPALAEELAPALAEAGSKFGDIDMCVVRPRSTKETSDVYLVYSDSMDAGMAASNLDGKTIAGWRANALQRK